MGYKMSYNLAFYTCFYGSNTKPSFAIPELPSLTYPCYYYTNNTTIIERLNGTRWIGIYHDIPTTDDLIQSCMVGKHVKTMTHEYDHLKSYDYLCFLDSKLNKVNEKIVEQFISTYFIKQDYALLIRHHWFIDGNVWHEFNESMKQKRYQLECEKYKTYINKQIDSGLSVYTPQHSACGLLIKNMKHKKMTDIGTVWFNHIQECGIQDQISFFFVKQFFMEYIHTFTESPF
jgi:hypothetical protein